MDTLLWSIMNERYWTILRPITAWQNIGKEVVKKVLSIGV